MVKQFTGEFAGRVMKCSSSEERFLIVTYKGKTYRAVSLSGNYLSEAEGKTVTDLMFELDKIEEVDCYLTHIGEESR